MRRENPPEQADAVFPGAQDWEWASELSSHSSTWLPQFGTGPLAALGHHLPNRARRAVDWMILKILPMGQAPIPSWGFSALGPPSPQPPPCSRIEQWEQLEASEHSGAYRHMGSLTFAQNGRLSPTAQRDAVALGCAGPRPSRGGCWDH